MNEHHIVRLLPIFFSWWYVSWFGKKAITILVVVVCVALLTNVFSQGLDRMIFPQGSKVNETT